MSLCKKNVQRSFIHQNWGENMNIRIGTGCSIRVSCYSAFNNIVSYIFLSKRQILNLHKQYFTCRFMLWVEFCLPHWERSTGWVFQNGVLKKGFGNGTCDVAEEWRTLHTEIGSINLWERFFLCFADGASQYKLSKWPTGRTNSCFITSLLHSSTCFEHCCAHHQEVELY
jgi:hypothetical protein